MIKVEPPDGDPYRHVGAVVPENSKVFQYLDRGKRSIVTDLATARGRATVRRMVRDIDVVPANFRPGAWMAQSC